MKSKRMTRTQLLMLATGKGLKAVMIYIVVWDVILAALCIMGRMNPLVTLITLLVIDVLIFAVLIHSSFQAKYEWENVRAMRRLLKNKTVLVQCMGKPLKFESGAWGYADENLFVRVNDASACVLFAPEIDLEKPCLHSKRRVYDNGKRLYAKYHEFELFEFQQRGGGSVTVQSDKVVPLQDWLIARGGRIIIADRQD